MTTPTHSAGRFVGSNRAAAHDSRRQRGLLGTTALSTGLSLLGATMLTLAPGQAHAQSCTTAAFPAYQCAGASDTPEIINADNAAVTTTPGFSVDTVGGNALSIAGRGALSYTDANASSLTSIDDGLSVLAAGDIGGVPGSVTISTNGDIHGNADGINISNQTSGATNLIATGNITASALFGVYVLNEASTTDLNVEAAAVSGGDTGIFAENRGTGATSITTTGSVVGSLDSGIRAINDATTTGGMSVQAASVHGGSNGIDAENAGGGKTSVTATGDVFGGARYGILATNGAVNLNPDGTVASVDASAATDLTVEVANVTGGIGGIYADNEGAGDTSITATGDVTSNLARDGGAGITAINGVAAGDLNVQAGSVGGGTYGIYADNQGTGDTSVTATGDVVATFNAGIDASNYTTAGDLSVNAASVVGTGGIIARNAGTGMTSVTASGDVAGTQGYGILATNGVVTFNPDGTVESVAPSGASDLTVDAASVTGDLGGIYANNQGTGETNVTATGDVSSTGGAGIQAFNGVTTTNGLRVNATSVSGATYGIEAVNEGGGMTSVTATGDVVGKGVYGILAINGVTTFNPDGTWDTIAPTNATGLTVDAASVTGGIRGILAINNAKGTTSVTATGDVIGSNGIGIVARNGATAGDLIVEAASVSGSDEGIYASNDGTEGTSVTATGAVSGGGGAGITALNGTAATALSVQAAGVSGATDGIFAQNDGTQATDVTATGLVTGASDTGIYATNGATATDLSVKAAAVSGGRVSIYADNEGTGDTSVTATGDAAGGSIGGIYALNGDTAGDLSVEAASASGASFGIGAQNNGAGATSVTATGDVASSAGEGIFAINGAGAGDLNVKAASVSGVTFGIDAENSGTGMTSVTATGDVSATQGYGILATNGAVTLDPEGNIDDIGPSAATGLTVEAAGVTGGILGIYIDNEGTGKTSVTATGDVRSDSGAGIVALNGDAASDLSVKTASVTGAGDGSYGIYAGNEGTGTTSITTTGDVAGALVGIYATNADSAGDLNVDVAAVSGGAFGIIALNDGTGGTSITARGLVEGQQAGIAVTSVGRPIDILIDGSDALVRSSSGHSSDLAVIAGGGPVSLTNNARLTGTVRFGDGDDSLLNHGTWTVAGGTSDFAGGADTLVNEADGVIVAGLSGAQAETTTFANLENTANRGTIALQDGGAGDVAHFSGDFLAGPGAVQTIDIDKAGRSDLVLIDGKATITGTTLDVANVGGFAFGTRYTVLSATGGLTGEFAAVNATTPPAAFLGLVDSYDANNAYLQYLQVRAFADAGLTRNQIATGTGLDSLNQSGALFLAAVALPDDASARAAFDQISGEIHTTVRTGLIEDSRLPREAVLGRLGETPQDGAGAWLQAIGNWGTNDGDGNAARLDRDTKGMLGGIDTALGDTLRVGIAGGYTNANLDVDARLSHADVKSYHALGYLGGSFGQMKLRAGIGYGHADIDTRRVIDFPGYTDQLNARYHATTWQGFGELGYALPVGTGAIEPFANAAVVRVSTDDVAEQGGAAALSVRGDDQTVTTTTLGLHATTSVAGPFSASATLGWRHLFGDRTPLAEMRLPGSDPFTIAGTPLSQDGAVAELGINWHITPQASLGTQYSGIIGGHSEDNAVKATLTFAF